MHEHALEQWIKDSLQQSAQAHQDRIAELEYSVMEQLSERPVSAAPQTWRWRLALAATAALLIFAGGLWTGSFFYNGARCADPHVLCLVYPNARSVTLAGQLTQWERWPLNGPDRNGIWWIELPQNLQPGRYEYGFMVDEYHWVHDPRAREFVHTFDNKINSVLIWPQRGDDQ